VNGFRKLFKSFLYLRRMNIHGVLFLKKNGFPEEFRHFRKLSEVFDFLKEVGGEKNLFIMGSDDRIKITDSPYNIKRFRRVHISSSDVEICLKELNTEMDVLRIPCENRIFSVGYFFNQYNVEFTGHALMDDENILIDIFVGLRGSGTDITPSFSFKIPIINNRPRLSVIDFWAYEDYVLRICLDMCKIKRLHYGNPYVDFVSLKDKMFYYPDLSFH